MDLWNNIDSLRAISHALVWIVVIGGMGAAVAGGLRFYIERRVGVLTAEARSREEAERNAVLQAKLHTTEQQLQESTSKLSDLERRAGPRSLTGEQRDKLVTTFKECPKEAVRLMAVLGDAEAVAFARTLESVFKEAGWESKGVSEEQFLVLPIGIILRLPSRTHPDPSVACVQRAFDSVGIDAPANLTDTPSKVLEIIVGQKPTMPR